MSIMFVAIFLIALCSSSQPALSTYVDKRCVINHVDLVAKNVVNVELKILPGSDEAICVVSLTSEANCELENFANTSISITGREEQISTSLWFNESSIDVASIKVCVQTECQSSRSRYSYKEIYFLPTGVPPVIKVCEVQNHLTLIESKNFEGENVYPIGVTHTDVHMSCSFERDPGRTKVTWCRNLDNDCEITTVENLRKFSLQIKLPIPPTAERFYNGTYYAYFENEFGVTRSHNVTVKMTEYPKEVSYYSFVKKVGEHVVMPCVPNVYWPYLDEFEYLFWEEEGWHDRITNNRHLYPNSLFTNKGYLVLFNLTVHHTKRYRCITRRLHEFEKDVVHSIINLTVLDDGKPLQDIPMTELKNVSFETVQVASSYPGELNCPFYGRPMPTIKWYDDVTGKELFTDHHRDLLVDNMVMKIFRGKNDSVRCEARDQHGRVEIKHFRQIGHVSPVIYRMPPYVLASVGDDVTVPCEYQAHNPTIRWFVNARQIFNEVESSNSWINKENITELLMKSVTLKSSGSIMCYVTNVWWEASVRYTYITVYERTFISSIEKVMLTLDNRHEKLVLQRREQMQTIYEPYQEQSIGLLKLTCNAITDQRTPIRIMWFVNEKVIPQGEYININDNMDSRETVDENLESPSLDCDIAAIAKDALTIQCSHISAAKVNITCLATNDLSTAYVNYIFTPSNNESNSKKYLSNNDLLKETSIDDLQDGGSLLRNAMHRDNWWGMLLVAVGGVVFFVLLALLFVGAIKLRKSRRSKSHKIQQIANPIITGLNAEDNTDTSSLMSETPAYPMVSRSLKKDLINVISSLLVPRTSLELKKCIGNGHFGRVYLATLMHGNQSAEIVAVKTMKYKAEECEMVELFLKEAVLMKDFQHPHVLGIKGITFADDSTPMVILPFMANGDLRNYILNPELNITILNLLMMGMQVAHGMAYLSSHHFVHRDLAARNCMVNNSGVVKIADFGMSRQLISCEYYRVKHGKDPFPVRWMAPECLEAKIFTTKSDVWAYGVLLWELMTRGAVPYAEVENWQVAGLIQSGELLKQPPFCPDVVYAIMMKCWTQDAQERPTFDQIISDVNSVVSLVNPEMNRQHQADEQQEPVVYTNVRRKDSTGSRRKRGSSEGK